jgi:hypothetical protein
VHRGRALAEASGDVGVSVLLHLCLRSVAQRGRLHAQRLKKPPSQHRLARLN